jgi:DNA/RNA-binding domain of Phe-tRNA-synthetase-like protein
MKHNFHIAEQLRNEIGHFNIYTITSTIKCDNTPLRLQKEIDSTIDEIQAGYLNQDIREIKSIQNIRTIMSKLGRNPNRYLNSIEAMLKRIQKDQSLYRINNIVDFNNYLSLRYKIPVGSYDRDKLMGDIRLWIGGEGEQYDSIGKGEFNISNLLIIEDEKGPFGSIVSDSNRTKITEETFSVFTILFFLSDTPINQQEMEKELQNLFEKLLGAKDISIDLLR